MSAPVLQLLDLFDALPQADKPAVAAEILRRLPDYGDVPESTMAALADELFLAMDAEEESRAANA